MEDAAGVRLLGLERRNLVHLAVEARRLVGLCVECGDRPERRRAQTLFSRARHRADRLLCAVRQVAQVAPVDRRTKRRGRDHSHHHECELGRDVEHGRACGRHSERGTQAIGQVRRDRLADHVAVHVDAADRVAGPAIGKRHILPERARKCTLAHTLDHAHACQLQHNIGAGARHSTQREYGEQKERHCRHAQAERQRGIRRREEVDDLADREGHRERYGGRHQQERHSERHAAVLGVHERHEARERGKPAGTGRAARTCADHVTQRHDDLG